MARLWGEHPLIALRWTNDCIDQTGFPWDILDCLPLEAWVFFPSNTPIWEDPACDNDCSQEHPYLEILEQRDADIARETLLESTKPMLPRERDHILRMETQGTSEDAEWERLETEFDLSALRQPDGFMIICLPDCMLLEIPANVPQGHEDDMLDGLDLQASDVPKVPIVYHLSRLC